MKKQILLALTVALSLSSTAFAEQEAYIIDTAHSSVTFSVKHMMISNVTGQFNEFSGTIMFDADDLTNSSATGTIQVASVDTDNDKRDAHLRDADFFDVAKYPEIRFESLEVKKKRKDYVMTGKFTMKDVTKTIEIPAKFLGQITDPWGNERIGFEAELTLDRTDYGVDWNKALNAAGGLTVGNEVTINLNVEAIKQKSDSM